MLRMLSMLRMMRMPLMPRMLRMLRMQSMLIMSLFRLRGHTCKFNPLLREQTLVAILQPTNMGMHFSRDSEANRTRIDINFNHLVFKVSPASIYIIYNSYNTFMNEFFSSETAEEKREK